MLRVPPPPPSGPAEPVAGPGPSAPAAPRPRLQSLTGMRGLAAVSVAVYHSLPYWHQYRAVDAPFQYGYLAVSFFFCLSGFVMAWTWYHGGQRSFILRRFARIYPLALLGLVVSLVAYAAWGNPLAGYVGSKVSTLAAATLTEAWVSNVPGIRQAWDGVEWSLACEAFFYVISPFLLPRLLRLRARTALIGLVLLYGVDWLVQYLVIDHAPVAGPPFLYFNPVARLPEYVMGVLVCRVVVAGKRRRPTNVTAVAAVGLAVPLWLYSWLVPTADRWASVAAMCCIPGFLLVIATGARRDLRRRRRRQPLLTTRPLVWLGDSSYALYCLHALVLGAMFLALGDLGIHAVTTLEGELYAGAFVVLAVVVAGLAHRWYEVPAQRQILRLARWRAERRGRRATAAALNDSMATAGEH